MPELSSATWGLLVALAFGAGFISSIAGAGGLITLPALLWAGVPPLFALGTNKVQSALGTLASTLNFLRSGLLQWPAVRRALAGAAVGAGLGALAVQQISNAALEAILPALLIIMALYLVLSPRIGDEDVPARIGPGAFDGMVAPAVGFYGGFFGPGMGSILPVLLVGLRGYSLSRATAHTKALVLVVNGVAALLFASAGRVYWTLALAMAGAQVLGAALGSGLVIRRGARLVQPLIVVVTLAVAAHLLWIR